MRIFIVLCLAALPLLSQGQQSKQLTDSTDIKLLQTYEDSLEIWSYMVLHDSIQSYRFGANKRLITTFVQALKINNSFQYGFEKLKHVSILYPPDSSFRIITWQLYVTPSDYRYYGTIQMNSEKLVMHGLSDRSFEIVDAERKKLSARKWYGALYYNIKQVDAPFGKYYVLFGYDANSFFNRRKVMDVLSFEEGQPQFGAPVFVKDSPMPNMSETKHRVILEYTAEASIGLNYSDEYGLVIYDHLIPVGGSYKGQGMTFVPDGSYVGYKLGEDGNWHHIDKVFNDFQETAPRPAPVLENRKDGLFGPKGKN